ncbi:hypothetical protein ACOME3_004883 [Neoechinorhynchus agilis]
MFRCLFAIFIAVFTAASSSPPFELIHLPENLSKSNNQSASAYDLLLTINHLLDQSEHFNGNPVLYSNDLLTRKAVRWIFVMVQSYKSSFFKKSFISRLIDDVSLRVTNTKVETIDPNVKVSNKSIINVLNRIPATKNEFALFLAWNKPAKMTQNQFNTKIETVVQQVCENYLGSDSMCMILSVEQLAQQIRVKREWSETNTQYFTHESYPIVFHLIFWSSVVFLFVLISSILLFLTFDPSQDNLVYSVVRLPAFRLKQE